MSKTMSKADSSKADSSKTDSSNHIIHNPHAGPTHPVPALWDQVHNSNQLKEWVCEGLHRGIYLDRTLDEVRTWRASELSSHVPPVVHLDLLADGVGWAACVLRLGIKAGNGSADQVHRAISMALACLYVLPTSNVLRFEKAMSNVRADIIDAAASRGEETRLDYVQDAAADLWDLQADIRALAHEVREAGGWWAYCERVTAANTIKRDRAHRENMGGQ